MTIFREHSSLQWLTQRIFFTTMNNMLEFPLGANNNTSTAVWQHSPALPFHLAVKRRDALFFQLIQIKDSYQHVMADTDNFMFICCVITWRLLFPPPENLSWDQICLYYHYLPSCSLSKSSLVEQVVFKSCVKAQPRILAACLTWRCTHIKQTAPCLSMFDSGRLRMFDWQWWK